MEPKARPRFYVLDDCYKLVLACLPSADDPLNQLYDAYSSADALPAGVEDIVRTLTIGWERMENPPEATAIVSGLRVTVSPLQGPVGRHIAVQILGEAPEWNWRAHHDDAHQLVARRIV